MYAEGVFIRTILWTWRLPLISDDGLSRAVAWRVPDTGPGFALFGYLDRLRSSPASTPLCTPDPASG